MPAGVSKQYRTLAGRPLLWHAVRALDVAPVEIIFVVLANDDREFAAQDWSGFGRRIEPLYCGGATRAESVHNGLIAAMAAIDPDDWVLVHDAARPCLPPQALARLMEALADDPVGGLLAVRAADTLKRGDAGDRVVETVARTGIWQAQTPQMFRRALLLRALAQAGPDVTDESSAVEALGLRPRLVPGDPRNIKVTFPEDLDLAGMILASREEPA